MRLDGAGGQLRVLVPRRAGADRAGHRDAELGPQRVRGLGHLALAEDHLHPAGRVAQVDEDDPAVVAPAGDPAGEGDGRPGVGRAQRPRLVRTDHGVRSLP